MCRVWCGLRMLLVRVLLLFVPLGLVVEGEGWKGDALGFRVKGEGIKQ